MNGPSTTPRWLPHVLVGTVVSMSLSFVTTPALADPQTTVGLTIGAAGRGNDRRIWDQTVFHLGLRGDVLFGRSNPHTFGVGPYLEVVTHAFDEVQLGTGITTLVPIFDAFPLVLSAGGYGRYASPYGIEPGVAGSIFWGTRSYNHHGAYNMSAGLLAQFRYGLGASGETAIVISAQLDGMFLSLPFHFLYYGIRGGSPETRPIR